MITKVSSQHERRNLVKPLLHWDNQDDTNEAMGSVKVHCSERVHVPSLAVIRD